MTATSLSVYTEMLSNNHLAETCPKKENKFLVGVFSGTGIAYMHSACFHQPPVCRVVTTFLFLVLISEITMLCGQHAVRVPNTVPSTK